jgi:hypothetical protein
MRAEWGGGDERPVTRGERLMLGNQIIRASDLDVGHSVVPRVANVATSSPANLTRGTSRRSRKCAL